MPIDPVRDAAIDVLLRVFDARQMHLDASLDKTLRRKNISDRGRRFLTQLVYGTVRHQLLCDHILRGICTQPLEKLPLPIHAILRMALFQSLFCDNVTPPAMVHTSVDLAKKRGHAGTARLVNAILRKAPKDMEAVRLPDPEMKYHRYLSVRHSIPPWLITLWEEQFGADQLETICEIINTPAPTCLRCNTLKEDSAALQERLAKSEIITRKSTPIPEELTFVEGKPPLRSKWFQDGYFIMQDPASLLPSHLLEPRPGERILDLCAAPGGKSTHIAQLANCEAIIAALDSNPRRIAPILENRERLGLQNLWPVVGDGAQAPFAPGSFDRVLVDAPCSGLGTLRRHPDLKWRITPETIQRLAVLQEQLLRSAIDLCKNGGVIVYSVCTYTREETTQITQALLEEGHVQPEEGPELLNSWKIAQAQYQTNPNDAALDGFYLTRFRKVSWAASSS